MDGFTVDNTNVTFRSVSQLNLTIKQKLKNDSLLGRSFTVEGELSNVSFGAKNLFFSLKDSSSVIGCAIWEYSKQNISRDDIKNGDKVIVRGSIDVWNNKGEYKLIATAVQPVGEGAVMARVKALQARLEAEGIFDEAHKKPIPSYPRVIGLITGRDSDAYYDVITRSFERNQHIKFVVRYSFMQGASAPADIVNSIRQLDPLGLDVIVIARGGGDTEDRWTFHDENIVRAIYNANTPIVTAIGHTRNGNHLADLVADRSVYVPKAVADDLIPHLGENLEKLDKYLKDFDILVGGRLNNLKLNADNYLSKLQAYSPKNQVDRKLQMLDSQEQIMTTNMSGKLIRYQNYAENIGVRIKANNPKVLLDKRKQDYNVISDKLRLNMDQRLMRYTNDFVYISTRLNGLSPTNKLINGFGYVSANGEPVRTGSDVSKGDRINITLSDSKIIATVDDVKKNDIY